ncbi:Copia protein, partial [Mucuna pruriens]
MTYGICEGLWMKIILDGLKVKYKGPMKLFCDNNLTMYIAHNPVQHDKTKHIEIDKYFIKVKLDDDLIVIAHIPIELQVENVLTKGLPRKNLLFFPISFPKLDWSNYATWAIDITVWINGQGYKEHLTNKVCYVDAPNHVKWEKIDGQLCNVIKSTLHSSIKSIFDIMSLVSWHGPRLNRQSPAPLLQLLILVIHLLAYLSLLPLILGVLNCSTSDHISSLSKFYYFSQWFPHTIPRNSRYPSPISFTIDSILYVTNCRFNLLSAHLLIQTHDCLITFTKDIVTLQD